MCGIVGAVTKRNVSGILLEGLQRLKYRGYDSAGLCVIDPISGALNRTRRIGDADELQKACVSGHEGIIGIAHNRWATHGKVTEENAHPHVSNDTVSVVHNGIIENYQELREELKHSGYQFTSDTDTEVLAHLLHREMAGASGFRDGVFKALSRLDGAYAIAVMHIDYPDTLVAARVGSPLVVGLGIDENFVASDPQALRPVTDRFIYLEEGEVVELNADEVSVFGVNREVIELRSIKLDDREDVADKGNFRHYMIKEIYDQPDAFAQTLEGRVTKTRVLEQAFGAKAHDIFTKVKAVEIVACGSSFYTGLVAKYWFEEIAGIPCSVEIASEQRYRVTAVLPGTLLVTLSQSGETADTLSALRSAVHENYVASLCLCNTSNSTMVRESDLTLMLNAGLEVCVASTKAFTNQLGDLLLLVLALGRYHDVDESTEAEIVTALHGVPDLLSEVLTLDSKIQSMAERFFEKHHALYLGRGIHYPIALEGALKLKEISYIHAEGYPAGELKHGPLALVDDDMPVVAVAPGDVLLEKLKSNLQEVKARGGELFIVGDDQFAGEADTHVIRMPTCHSVVSPIIYTMPMQLLAYHVAVFKGTDVDQPRNLAKSVTVE